MITNCYSEESYQTIFYETENDSQIGMVGKASKNLIGYDEHPDKPVFLTTQIEHFSQPVRIEDLKLALSSDSDLELFPEIPDIGLDQRAECGQQMNVPDEKKVGYVWCSIQIQITESKIYSIVIHGTLSLPGLQNLLNDILESVQGKINPQS